MKCINCGKNTEKNKLIDNICSDCYSKTTLVKDIKDFTINYCNECKKLSFGSRTLKDISGFIEKKLIIDDHAVIDYIESTLDLENDILSLEVDGHFDFEQDKVITEKYDFNININHHMCGSCKQKSSQSFSTIIQLRNKNNKQFEKIMNSIIKEIDKDEHNNIVKIDEQKTGVDFYTTNIERSSGLIKKRMIKYGGKIKITKKLYGLDKMTSKKIYRVTILAKLLDYSIGDITFIEKSIFEIVKFNKEGILLKDIYNSKSKIKSYDFDLKTLKKEDFYETQVISIKPDYMVLNKNYENILLKTRKAHKVDDQVKVYVKGQIAYEV